MKHFFTFLVLTSLFSSMVFADDHGETKTECPYMKEENRRHNPKENLDKQVPKPSTKSAAQSE